MYEPGKYQLEWRSQGVTSIEEYATVEAAKSSVIEHVAAAEKAIENLDGFTLAPWHATITDRETGEEVAAMDSEEVVSG